VNRAGSSPKTTWIGLGLGGLLVASGLAASSGCLVFDGKVARAADAGAGEASVVDGGGAPEAGGDRVAFCASLPSAAFCSEFGDSNFGEWSNRFNSGNGLNTVDDRVHLSPPLAYVSSTPALTGNAANAFLARQLLGAASGKKAIELRFSARFESSAPPSPVTFARLTLSRGADAYLVFLNRNESELWAVEGPAATDLGDGVTATPNDTWTDFTIRIEIEGATYFVTIKEGTRTLVSRKASTPPAAQRDDVTVDLGMLYASGPAGAQQVRYDNVVLLVE
jgi:hypothetical protein